MPTLNWIGKEAVVDHHRRVPTRLLECDPSLSVGDPDAENLLVDGDNLASLTALTSSGDDKRIDPPLAAAVFFPPTDFTDYGGQRVDPRDEGRFGKVVRQLAFREGVEGLDDVQIEKRLVEISPARQVHAEAPPFLLIHGDADPAVPLQQSQRLLSELQAQGVDAELIVKPGGGHPWPTIYEEVATLADWFDRRLNVAGTESDVDRDN